MTIDSPFALGDKVWIKELETVGTVLAILLDGLGLSHRIRYFSNSEGKEVYFYSGELEPYSDQQRKIGITPTPP